MPDPLQCPVPESFETPRLLPRPFSVADAPHRHGALVESIDALREHLWFLPWVAEPQTLRSAEARCRQAQSNFLLRLDLPYLASRAVALRCGFRLEGVLRHAVRSPDGRLRSTCLYARLPGEG